MLLDLITPQRVVMVEPQPQAFAVLTEKFRGRPGFELHNVAVSDHAGAARLKITRDSTGVSLLAPLPEMRALVGSNWTVESEIEVPVTTLDQLLANEPEISLLKIDVQGVEREVLAGARETLSMTKFVLIELNYMSQYQGGSWFANVHQILTDEHGFFLANASRPLVLNGRASMCDGLYVNPKLVPNFVKPDFV
jgi:FkbM family methyltransferase